MCYGIQFLKIENKKQKMERELKFALQLLGMSLSELRTKMIFQNLAEDHETDDDECIQQIALTRIYTDGACPRNGFGAKQASIGIFFGDGDSRNISSLFNMENPTNNRAELFAILIALENSEGPVEICSDSKYSINCVTLWMEKWERNDWKTAGGKPVKNKELILDIKKRMENRHVKFRYVSNFDHKKPRDKTNKDHYGNYMADKLANDALL